MNFPLQKRQCRTYIYINIHYILFFTFLSILKCIFRVILDVQNVIHYQLVSLYDRSCEIFILIFAQPERIRPGGGMKAAEFKARV